MATNIYPTCTRAVDPYAAFNSNVVNILQRSVTRGVNCLHSGANGDETTDDTTSIQLAFSASVGNTIYFPSGNYKITSGLVATI